MVSRFFMWRRTRAVRIDYEGIHLVADEIELRPFTTGDAARFAQIVQDPEIVRFSHLPTAWRTESGALEHIQALPERASRGQRIDLAIGAPDSDVLFGHATLRRIDWRRRRAVVGTWVAPEWRGRGIAATSLRLLSAWAFSELRLLRIDADPDWDNVASQRMLERIGYQRGESVRLGRRTAILYSLPRRGVTDAPDALAPNPSGRAVS